MRPCRELEIADLARDEKHIEEQKARMLRLAVGGGSASCDSDSLLSLLEFSQKLFLIKRELEQGE